MSGDIEEQIKQVMALEWHWSQPGWPAALNKVDGLSSDMIVYRCFYCKAEFVGAPVIAVLHHHMCHNGRTPAITMYPISVGLAPRGGDQ